MALALKDLDRVPWKKPEMKVKSLLKNETKSFGLQRNTD